MRLDAWLAEAEGRLAATGVESPRLEAQVLAAHALGQDRSWVLSHGEHAVIGRRLESPLARRAAGEPLAYIVGFREFYGRRFAVDRRVLIPRHETECVVERALAEIWLRGQCRVLDLGLGSGCIAITLALETRAEVSGSEACKDALEVARANAHALGARVDMRLSDLFSAFGQERWDVVVSNPPYVAPGARLPVEVGAFEPSGALFAGSDGYAVLDRLIEEAWDRLAPDGAMVLEVGDGQSGAVVGRATGLGWQAEAFADLSGRPRGVCLRRP